MQNQYSNGSGEMNHQSGNQMNPPAQKSSTKYYILGMVTGILAAVAVALGDGRCGARLQSRFFQEAASPRGVRVIR